MAEFLGWEKMAKKAAEYALDDYIYKGKTLREWIGILSRSEKPNMWIGAEVLDKIRAEIEDLDRFYDNDYFSGNRDSMFKCNEVMQIIDKYKASPTGAESEGKG